MNDASRWSLTWATDAKQIRRKSVHHSEPRNSELGFSRSQTWVMFSQSADRTGATVISSVDGTPHAKVIPFARRLQKPCELVYGIIEGYTWFFCFFILLKCAKTGQHWSSAWMVTAQENETSQFCTPMVEPYIFNVHGDVYESSPTSVSRYFSGCILDW